ncbi:MAG: MFS transporter [Promethearchaeota archaeon]|jgi:GPH family glycoside/pentoside/hexuronide:cation symporter
MSETDEIKREGTSNSKKILFSAPRLGTSIVLGIEGWALLTLYTSGYGLHPFLAGLSISIGYLTIAITQFLFGWLSDAKYTKWGRRKPYMIILAPFLGISTIFLLLPGLIINIADKGTLFIWMLIWEITFRASYAVTTPYQAWMAEEFPINERPKVSQFQNTFNYLGNAIMALFSLFILVGYVNDLKVDPNTPIPINFSIPVILFGALIIILFYLIAFKFPTEPHYKITSNLLDNLKTIVKNKNFMFIVIMVGISGFGWSMITSVMLKYLTDVLDLEGLDYIIPAVALILTIFIFLYLWRRSIQKLGKKKSLLYLFIIAAVFLPVSLLGLIPMNSYLVIGIIFIVGIGAILGGWFLFPYIVYADVAEDDEKITGELKAGIYAGFPSIILNLFQAGGAFLIGTLLSLPDLERHYVADPYSFSIGLIIFGPIVSIILLISYFYTKKYVELDFDWEKKENS